MRKPQLQKRLGDQGRAAALTGAEPTHSLGVTAEQRAGLRQRRASVGTPSTLRRPLGTADAKQRRGQLRHALLRLHLRTQDPNMSQP